MSSVSNISAQPRPRDGYDILHYNEIPRANPVATLAANLESGAVSLDYDSAQGGYLSSLLTALNIDPASQLLIFSKTSLQYSLISPQTPRAIYFNENTYIGWVNNSDIVEVMTMDDSLGLVFYVFNNVQDSTTPIVRGRLCLGCHDSYGGTGYGVPLLLARSSVYSTEGKNLLNLTGADNITDSSPISERWGGWYVTGQHGSQTHMGNFTLTGLSELEQLDDFRRGNIDSLNDLGLFDTEPYLTTTSDIVAFMVLEHQLTVQNQILYIKFRAAALLERIGLFEMTNAISWAALSPRAQQVLTRMLDELVNLMLFDNNAELEDTISGSEDYASGFLEQRLTDEHGNSLRDFDLNTRLFKYPLSYLIYSEEINNLPAYAKDYVFEEIASVLEGRNEDKRFDHISINDRNAVLEILQGTTDAFAPYLGLNN